MKNADKNKMAEEYDKLASKFTELYLSGRERGRDAMLEALDKAQKQLLKVEVIGAEYGEELKQLLARDLDQVITNAQRLGGEAKEKFHPSRLGAGALASLANALELTSNALHNMSDKTRTAITYKTGEVTSAGTLTCQACKAQIQLKETAHIPPCPKCAHTLFSKSY
jgi:isocitrate dehydrogenase